MPELHTAGQAQRALRLALDACCTWRASSTAARMPMARSKNSRPASVSDSDRVVRSSSLHAEFGLQLADHARHSRAFCVPSVRPRA
jgi:hypothetical protein